MIAAKRDWGPFTGLVELLHVSSDNAGARGCRAESAPAPDAAPGRSANALVTIPADRLVYRSRLNPDAMLRRHSFRAGPRRRSVAACRGAA